MRKQMTRVIVQVMEASLLASNIDAGTQFKVVDRVLQRGLLTEHDSLVSLLDAITEELVVARHEVDKEG